jgi:hypothetical protein
MEGVSLLFRCFDGPEHFSAVHPPGALMKN